MKRTKRAPCPLQAVAGYVSARKEDLGHALVTALRMLRVQFPSWCKLLLNRQGRRGGRRWRAAPPPGPSARAQFETTLTAEPASSIARYPVPLVLLRRRAVVDSLAPLVREQKT